MAVPCESAKETASVCISRGRSAAGGGIDDGPVIADEEVHVGTMPWRGAAGYSPGGLELPGPESG